MADLVERGRSAFAHRAWADAFRLLSAAEHRAPLDPGDLERLAVAAYLTGRDEASDRAWERAHLECLHRDEPDAAARCAFWVGLALLLRGEMARASGWLGRANRLVDGHERDCVARGYLLVPVALEALESGDPAGAEAMAIEIGAIAERFGDADLRGLALLSRGQAAIELGDRRRGLSLLDEVMVAVTTGEISPVPAGIVYCAVIDACMTAFDYRRAGEWTDALSDWCEQQPDLVPYRGQCLVHRSQILQVHGEWEPATTEAARARELLSRPPHPALALAQYQQGDLCRLRGELAEAERWYREASAHGFEPMPGLALLRLAAGEVETAVSSIRRAVQESSGHPARPARLGAAVEILLAAGDVAAARAAADELAGIAANLGAAYLHALSAHSSGAVLLGEGEAAAALGALREAVAGWRALEMPYEAARARALVGQACRALGDEDSAGLELDAARAELERLGAGVDLERLGSHRREPRSREPSSLTAREREVLRLVAGGLTNREIAASLVISEHTVGRHVQNIFTKLGVSSRAAATAHAYEHGLV